ncbi:unnamed protein product [Enterobius vermicularis]|uniref:MARVEL domain-containing protein n=1 Tax=Enterobius vermicularis TaxID=51028 RepID=A0A0N4UW71_ENTVE|nr:unnamed protein product [Enterobius vermicularis]
MLKVLYFRCNSNFQQAALFVAISALALSVLNGSLMYYGIYSVNFTFDLILLFINTAAAAAVFYALYYEKASYILPFLITQIAQCALFFSLALCTVYFLLTYKRQNPSQRFDQIIMIISIAIGIGISSWAIWVAAKCYHFLRNQSETATDSSSIHRSLWR